MQAIRRFGKRRNSPLCRWLANVSWMASPENSVRKPNSAWNDIM